jgi:integration host factor subunit beta
MEAASQVDGKAPAPFRTMTRSTFLLAVGARQPHLRQDDTGLAVKLIMKSLTDALVCGRRVEIRGFGSFRASPRPARVGRNPSTGEVVQIPPKTHVRFKAAHELRQRVNRGYSALRRRDAGPRSR